MFVRGQYLRSPVPSAGAAPVMSPQWIAGLPFAFVLIVSATQAQPPAKDREVRDLDAPSELGRGTAIAGGYESVADAYAAARPFAWWRLRESADVRHAADVLRQHSGRYLGRNSTKSTRGVEVGHVRLPREQLTILAWMRMVDGQGLSGRIVTGMTAERPSRPLLIASVSEQRGAPRLKARLRLHAEHELADVTAEDTTLPLGHWVLLGVVYDGWELSLYQDGELVGVTAAAGALPRSPMRLWLGCDPTRPEPRNFPGELRDVALFDEALGAELIHAIAVAGRAADAAAPQGVAEPGPQPLAESPNPAEFLAPDAAPPEAKPQQEPAPNRVADGDSTPNPRPSPDAGPPKSIPTPSASGDWKGGDELGKPALDGERASPGRKPDDKESPGTVDIEATDAADAPRPVMPRPLPPLEIDPSLELTWLDPPTPDSPTLDSSAPGSLTLDPPTPDDAGSSSACRDDSPWYPGLVLPDGSVVIGRVVSESQAVPWLRASPGLSVRERADGVIEVRRLPAGGSPAHR